MARDADDYEKEYMTGDGEVVHRDKMRAPGWFALVFALPVLVQLLVFGVGIATMKHFPPALLLVPALFVPFQALLFLLFSVLRITVTKQVVHVQYGLFGPKIPIAAIASAQVVTYDWKKYGGWGIRRARDGSRAYNMMGDAGRAVKIVWDDRGKTQTTLVASKNPEAVAEAIAIAKRGGAAGAGALRVGGADAEAELMAEAEREAAEIERAREVEEAKKKGAA